MHVWCDLKAINSLCKVYQKSDPVAHLMMFMFVKNTVERGQVVRKGFLLLPIVIIIGLALL